MAFVENRGYMAQRCTSTITESLVVDKSMAAASSCGILPTGLKREWCTATERDLGRHDRGAKLWLLPTMFCANISPLAIKSLKP